MSNFLTPLTYSAFIEWPSNPLAWVSILILGGLLAWVVIRSHEMISGWGRREWLLLSGLILLSIVGSIFIGQRLPAQNALPRALLPEDPRGPALMIFSALPWMLAAGFLGPAAAAVVGVFSGLVKALFDSHSLFTVIQTLAAAVGFSLLIRQNYRTLIYRIVRHPAPAALVVAVGMLPVIFLLDVLGTNGPLVIRVDYALARLPSEAAAFAAEMLLGGLICEAAAAVFRNLWGNRDPLVPSPEETSLQTRFFYATGPLVMLLLAALMAGDWFLAGRGARLMLEDRMGSTARMVAAAIPNFLEAGQNLLLHLASDTNPADVVPGKLPDVLSNSMRSVPFFRQLYVFDAQGNPVNGYPERDAAKLSLTGEELQGITLALKGISVQSYTGGAVKGESTALISFIAALSGEGGQVNGVILGRADLASNPYTKPVIESLQEISKTNTLGVSSEGSYGMILDENGRVLYHPSPGRVMTTYLGEVSPTASLLDETSPDGARSLVYFQPISGKPWAVVVNVPARHAQQLALTIAVPLLLMVVLIALVAIVSLRIGLKRIAFSLETLESEAGRISRGELDHALQIKGVDEIGRLGQAFEGMRLGLKAQLGELNRLLDVSQGVAGNLNTEGAVQPILLAALATGAASARVVLLPAIETTIPGEPLESYGFGENSAHFSYLDEQIAGMIQTHERIVMPNLTRGKGLNLRTSVRPRAVIALPLRHENELLGTLWLGYDTPHNFTEDEIRFLTTLAGEAAMAAANTRLYARAEIGRQRVEAILDSTPDPVLVTDSQNNLLLINPAARQLPGMAGVQAHGQPVEKVVQQPELLDLIRFSGDSRRANEFQLEDGRVFYTTVSLLSLGEEPVGKVCILRDITHFKKMDTIKSDFVALVSHDLRTPLSLMSGYATMIQMVGELNEQQKTYIRRITSGVESMTHLVNNLLDLGRIDTGVGLQLEKLPVSDLLDRVVNSLQLQAAQKNIQIGREFDEEDNPVVCVDQALIHQALYNLLENAIKYTPVGGKVDVRAAMHRSGVVFSVADTGIGIAPLDQPRLFEKFFRAGQREAYPQRGSGLGLAIVKSVAERHGGKVWVESSLGKGSIFFLEVPYAQPQPVLE